MKKQTKPNPASTISRRYLSREQAAIILELLESEGLPEHDSPFKLYFNGKLVASASQPNQITTNNIKDNETRN
jgi:hypothetical protein